MQARDERGVALVIAMFMMVIVSALGAAMVHVARTETLSTANYTSMSQARYAAESGLAAAANYLLSAGFEAVAPGTAGDPLSNYNLTVSPVTRIANATPVVLSSDASTADNYPVMAVVNAFQTASSGTLGVGQGTAAYSARARLLSMRQIVDAYSGQPRLLQTWEITGVGRRAQGLVSGEVEVSAIIDRSTRPVFNYAGYAVSDGCGAIAFNGSASTRSYDSRTATPGNTAPPTQDSGGHIGSNGNLSGSGSADIHGTMSTPRAGVGNCTANNVTAATVAALGSVSDGLIQLPQPVEFPTPEAPSPMPPTNDLQINGATCPGGFSECSTDGSKTTWDPALSATPGIVTMGNVSLAGNAQVYLKGPGTYVMNSLTISGNTKIIVDENSGGPVRIVLAGKNSDGTDMSSAVFSVTGNGVDNTTWDPTNLRIEYAGTGTMDFSGNGDTAALIYAPKATGNFTGNADFFGSVIMNQLNFGGSTVISYDRALQQSALTVGNAMMTTFTWRTF